MFRGSLVGLAFQSIGYVHASLENPARSRTPPMGFNDWARFECSINQTLFTETADAMASKGLLNAGYNRINLDDCWPQQSRLSNGSLMWNSTLFPQGLIWLANYVKKKGFHLGIYSDAGNLTCGGYPGSLNHEQQDADTFTSWGIDYLKLDGCNVYATPGQSSEAAYQELYARWHRVLKGPATPLIFSESAPAYFCCESNLSDWFEVMDWVPGYGELARHSTDIATYNSTADPWSSVMQNYHQELRLAREQGPGYFNDPDMLIPDEPNLSLEEKRSHFALWASFSAPLFVSAWVPGLGADEVRYLTNRDLIAVDQDPLALQATLVSSDGVFDVLTKPLAGGDRLLTILNTGGTRRDVSVPLARIGWVDGSLPRGGGPQGPKLSVKDLWAGTISSLDLAGSGAAAIAATVPSHGTAVYRISLAGPGHGRPPPSQTWTPTGVVLNAASFHCLTLLQSGGLSWATCDGSDGQVWQVWRNGSSVRPLSTPGQCLGVSGSMVTLGGCRGVQWQYSRAGNVVNVATKQCLTEGKGGSVLVQKCGFLVNSQVFELPSGWQL